MEGLFRPGGCEKLAKRGSHPEGGKPRIKAALPAAGEQHRPRPVLGRGHGRRQRRNGTAGGEPAVGGHSARRPVGGRAYLGAGDGKRGGGERDGATCAGAVQVWEDRPDPGVPPRGGRPRHGGRVATKRRLGRGDVPRVAHGQRRVALALGKGHHLQEHGRRLDRLTVVRLAARPGVRRRERRRCELGIRHYVAPVGAGELRVGVRHVDGAVVYRPVPPHHHGAALLRRVVPHGVVVHHRHGAPPPHLPRRPCARSSGRQRQAARVVHNVLLLLLQRPDLLEQPLPLLRALLHRRVRVLDHLVQRLELPVRPPRNAVSAAHLLEDRRANPEPLRNLIDGKMKVLRQLLVRYGPGVHHLVVATPRRPIPAC
mmetsp:Transcript_26068/g.72996  ORF Transcript_26068/g.72996 Transcript_26068/m.72996 type:complete len:370 (-) Transcript_26068:205-1314(-)